MDYSNALGSEFQTVRNVEREGQPARVVECARDYAADATTLWAALTDPECIPRWFLPISGDLKVGGRYQLEGNAGGSILVCDSPEVVEVTWEFGGNTSWLNLRLTPQGDGVRLILTHTMPQDDASEEHWAKYGPGATGVGWDLSFVGLALHLENDGASIDQEASMAWMTSDEGKVFIRASAESWGRAHVASGESAEVAEAMAQRTASFYTGE